MFLLNNGSPSCLILRDLDCTRSGLYVIWIENTIEALIMTTSDWIFAFKFYVCAQNFLQVVYFALFFSRCFTSTFFKLFEH